MGTFERLFGELGCTLEVAPCLDACCEGARSLARAREELSSTRLDLERILGVGLRIVRGDVVGGDDLGDLLLALAERRSQRLGSCEVAAR